MFKCDIFSKINHDITYIDIVIHDHDVWWPPTYDKLVLWLGSWYLAEHPQLFVWLLEGIVLQVRIFGHIFFRKSRNLYLAPPGVRGTIRPYPGGCMVLWVYRDVGQNQEPIRTQYFKWSQNYESDPRSLPLIELETRVREVFTITDVAFSLLLVESAY